jgi:hypothetical protein
MPMMRMHMSPSSTMPMASTTVYTIDATNAKIIKDGATSTIASVSVNDVIMAQGTVTGTNVVATVIRDGMGGSMNGEGGGRGEGTSTRPMPPTTPIQGNGQPVVAGTITVISGNTITVTNASNVTYTIDATSAKIVKNGTTTVISGLATGDSLVIQGTVNGNSVTASSIIDQGVHVQGGSPTTTPVAGSHNGFLGTISDFFKHIFGF